MQTNQLLFQQEQKNHKRPFGIEKILQALQKTYFAQRSQIIQKKFLNNKGIFYFKKSE